MSAVEILTICNGATSMYLTVLASTTSYFSPCLATTEVLNWPVESITELDCAIQISFSSSAVKYSVSPCPNLTYGDTLIVFSGNLCIRVINAFDIFLFIPINTLPLESLIFSVTILPSMSLLWLDNSSYTFTYGVCINPNSLVLAYVAKDPSKPIFGPSGVSIGQIRP